MKNIFFILLLPPFLSCTHPKSKSEKIIDFIDAHLGQRISHGVCKDLPIYALGVSHEWLNNCMKDSAFREQHYVERKDIQAGDLIIYFNPINKSGDTTHDYHIGIIYKTINDSTTIIAEQNHYSYGDEPDKAVICSGDTAYVCSSSRVILTTINLHDYPESKECKKNHLSFYRL